MKPFSHLIVTFTQDTSSEKRVRMAHSMIAQSCTELMAEAGVTRSDTARNIMNIFCIDEVPTYLLGFVKDMLTKREEKKQKNPCNGKEIQEKKEKFSRLILDIKKNETTPGNIKRGKVQSASVLKVASKRFPENPFFPQALARFYYIELQDYNLAETWAKRAKERDPQNSFIADTLGQVYKNHLKSKNPDQKTGCVKSTEIHGTPRELLQLAARAIQAFKHEEQLAENEFGKDLIDDGNTQFSNVHNTRGQFGYLQVCNILYDLLVSQNENWRRVLTQAVSLESVLKSLEDNKLSRYHKLIKSLKGDVKTKCDFLNAYLTYSKPGLQKEDPPDCWRTVTSCYKKYAECPEPNLVLEIMNKVNNDTPEHYIAAIFKEWPTDNRHTSLKLMQLIDNAKHSYELKYSKYFRSRHLRPLFYLGNEDSPSKVLPANRLHCLLETRDETDDFINYMIKKDKIFRDLRVQGNLLKCEGKVENYSVIFKIGGHNINIEANMQESTWVPREVTFYLGFTIRGLVAFGIQKKTDENGPTSTCESCDTEKAKDSGWTTVNPKSTTKNNVTTYSLQSEPGRFQCSLSALRWVCKTKVSFTYQFKSWEDHQENLKKVHCTPAGPLLEITEEKGKLDDVYLPHWVCVNGLTTVTEKFAVFHSKDVGNFVEQVSEVKSSHMKLFHPSFTTNGVLLRAGFAVQVHCNMLICQTKDQFLTLRVYLIPQDPALQQELELRERSKGSTIIQKPNSVLSLRMQDSFSLSSNVETAKPSLPQIQLSHERSKLEFFTVFIKNANCDFKLTLQHKEKPMWSCEIKKDEFKVKPRK